MRYVVLRDKRVSGGVPSRPHLRIVNFDKDTSVTRAFHEIRACAAAERVHTVFIICHGLAGGDFVDEVCVDGAGGLGLQLGRERILHENVAMWTAIRGLVKNIVVYSCMAAQARPGSEGTRSDGRYLMRALALHTQATVYASDTAQDAHYWTKHGALQMGGWEGKLFRFAPDGWSCAVAHKAPVEFNEMLGGRLVS